MDEKTQINIPCDIPYPTPLTPTKSPPPFPLDALPQTIRNMVEFVSETTQVYPDMPAAVALAALSVCLQGKAKVHFSEHWAEELNLYILISAPPGERKSAVFSAMTKPVTKYVIDYNEKHRLEVQTYYNTRKQLELKLNKAIEKDKDTDTIVWDKCNGKTTFSDCEIAYCSFNDSVRMFRYMWNGMMQGKSIDEGHIMQGNKKLNEKRIHPTQKPIKLYEWLLQKYANPGDIILDTHVGSASSLIAFQKHGYEFVGTEKDPVMYKLSLKRLEDFEKAN